MVSSFLTDVPQPRVWQYLQHLPPTEHNFFFKVVFLNVVRSVISISSHIQVASGIISCVTKSYFPAVFPYILNFRFTEVLQK